MSQWISIKDKLPAIGQDILLYGIIENNIDFFLVAYLDNDNKFYAYSDDIEDALENDGWEVTHWLPLPQPPIAENV